MVQANKRETVGEIDPTLLSSLRWRCIGPYRGGRVVAVAGHPTEQMVSYFGACSGGVWKTEDGGTIWENISDGYFKTAAVGAIAVSESDPNVIYVGMGESCIRGNVSHGDGVYKSTDGGQTWRSMGLEDTRHIARVRIHPQDPDIVYVSALGHAFGPNEDRGVFRSKDGGESWKKVLYVSENAGAVDLSLDPRNPRVLYAAIWQARRSPWELVSGGPESGIHKSTDGGDTWTEITGNSGLPEGIKGRIGVSISPARTDRVWAIIETEERGLYRSDDGGATWERVSDDPKLVQRPWYYMHVFADPQDPDTVWVLDLYVWKSTDGGRTFTEVKMPHGDHHDLWIDPKDTQHMVQGNDGGACVTFNGGDSWSSLYNQPTSQFYHTVCDDEFPYRVYATQQDNTAISVPSRSHKPAILWSDCYTVGNSESGHIAVKPGDPNIVYSGGIGSTPGGGDSLLRYDHSTSQVRAVSVWPELYWGWGLEDHKYRFQWTYPIQFSPHDVNTLYVAANVLFRSKDEGSSWEVISPDLTRDDKSKMGPSGGPITKDTTFVEHYGTIFAFVESPHEPGLFWAGSDDGLVHISRDAGQTWAKITPKDIPEWTRIDVLELSHHDPATAYMSATRHKFDDKRPLLYKTNDYGKSWTSITTGIPEDDFTRVIREDPVREGLLYAGTETGVYISFDDGDSWQRLQNNLPAVPVHDLVVKDNELVAGTHGRAFWILDDLTLLRQMRSEVIGEPAHLFAPASTYRIAPPMDWTVPNSQGKVYGQSIGAPSVFRYELKPNGEVVRQTLNSGTNPPEGVLVTYYLREKPEGPATLTFLDTGGAVIKSFTSEAPEEDGASDWPKEAVVPVEPGMNRFMWNMRYPDAELLKGGGPTPKGAAGPMAPVGRYQVRLQVGDQAQTEPFELIKDPRLSVSQDELDEQFGLLLRIRDRISETHDAAHKLRSVRRQVDEWVVRADAAGGNEVLSQRAEGIREKLAPVEEEIIRAHEGEYDRLNLPQRLNAKLGELTFVVASADAAPTRQSYDVFDDLSARVEDQIEKLQEVIDKDLVEFVDTVHELEIPVIVAEPAP